nr:hypothetical protein CFP56_63415 [Quercus suber]POE94739.1 hypothetical protein CFP56_16976 [Quercus suber]
MNAGCGWAVCHGMVRSRYSVRDKRLRGSSNSARSLLSRSRMIWFTSDAYGAEGCQQKEPMVHNATLPPGRRRRATCSHNASISNLCTYMKSAKPSAVIICSAGHEHAAVAEVTRSTVPSGVWVTSQIVSANEI